MRTIKRLCGLLVAAILLLEAFLRYGLGLGHPLLYIGDADVGYMPAPNQDLYRFFVHVRTNAFGMRSDCISREKAQNHRRILFVGDSVTFGTTFVDQHDIFTGIIKERLEKKHTGRVVDVLNMSAGGWAPANEVGFLKSRGTFDADVVVLVLNTEDLDQPFSRFEPSPQYPIDNYLFAVNELWPHYILPLVFTFEKEMFADPKRGF